MTTSEDLPATISDVSTPCFLVNIDIVQRNAKKMIDQCSSLGLRLRPHMKTHKCLEIGKIATGGSKRCICVSTVREAEFYADDGYDDIVFAALFSPDKIPRLKKLALRLDEFHLLVDSDSTVSLLEEQHLDNKKWSVLLKVDCGGSRCGVLWDGDDGLKLAQRLSSSPFFKFNGLYTHEGQSYHARGVNEVQEIGDQTTERVLQLANRLREAGLECKSVGIGSTPTASRPTSQMKSLTELHPGNYLFYDVWQNMIGACDLEDVAVRVAARVIGHYPHRNQLLIDVGWTALSLDGQGQIPNGSYCLFEDEPNLRLLKMTQEVGFVEPRRGKISFDKYPIGKLLLLYPFHSCASSCMHPQYLIHSGEKIVDAWTPCRGW